MPFIIQNEIFTKEGSDPTTGPVELSFKFCSTSGCENYKNLSKCAKCRTAMYCSRECQKQDWPHHKAFCKLASAKAAVAPTFEDSEPPLRRNLRHFTARFNNTLVMATIAALELMHHPEHLDTQGLVVTLEPRPHANTGARFSLATARVHPLEDIAEILGMQGEFGIRTMQMHLQERENLKQRTRGNEDFAAMLVIAENKGAHLLPGDHPLEVRFKPIHINWSLVRGKQFAKPRSDIDWIATLCLQIEQDLPVMAMHSK
ncbi:hypothetical protein BDZ89DRAFT_1154542 [Hymenopellis radicata]|nr:hypothetical protein BDZ89DRAFT_1154542 [Hymenopellis radicata]